MTKIYKDVSNEKGDTYNVMVEHEDNILTNFNCTCRFMSFDFWSNKFQSLGTICRHILNVCAQNNIELPEEYKTERNLKVLNSYKLAQDGKHYFFEVILVDPSKPEIKSDKNMNWIGKNSNTHRVHRGLTSAGKKSRGLRDKSPTNKARPSVRAGKRRGK